MITVSKEDYLKAILEAESEGESVISATLAHWLSVSPPAVTMALRRLKKDALVTVQADGHVRLTAAGRKIARKLTLRHHLIERMLAEIFGMARRSRAAGTCGFSRLRSEVAGQVRRRWRLSAWQLERVGESGKPPAPGLVAAIPGRRRPRLRRKRHI